MNQIEDVFDSPEFKSLPKWEKFKFRLKVAFFTFISYH